MDINWDSLVFKLNKDEILEAVKDPEWQAIRRWMKGKNLETKYSHLVDFLTRRAGISGEKYRTARVCVANYVNALKRGGLI